MKILHFGCAYLPYMGGSTIRIKNLVYHYRKGCEKLDLITHVPSGGEQTDAPFDRVWRISAANSVMPLKEVLSIVRRGQYDVVVLHNSRVLFAWLVWYRWISMRTRVVVEIHSVRDAGSLIKRYLNRLLYRRVDRVVHLGEGARAYFERQYGLVPGAVIRNGSKVSDSQRIQRKKEYASSSCTFTYVGSFYDWQGVVVLARALALVNDDFWQRNKVIFVGDGPALNQVKSILKEIRNDRLVIMGWQPKAVIDKVLTDADFLLAPRISTPATETVVPLKVSESIETGIPLIATRVGGLLECLPETAAFYIEPGSVAQLADRLMNPPSESEYRKVCAELASLKFPTWEESGRQYIDLFSSVRA